MAVAAILIPSSPAGCWHATFLPCAACRVRAAYVVSLQLAFYPAMCCARLVREFHGSNPCMHLVQVPVCHIGDMTTKKCSSCNEKWTWTGFSGSQWAKVAAKRVCKRCANSGGGGGASVPIAVSGPSTPFHGHRMPVVWLDACLYIHIYIYA